ncbi:response regulator [Defluviimonas sp. SAOS-178_SWC]|uniref:response regulator n=1 Tax=Defluviimonas sp. SAOS-178_SWC TaxID=3121287 RepID=UPI003221788E
MAMIDRATWQDEITRQRERLEADLVSRQIGIALTCVVFGFFLPFWAVFLTYLVIVGSEVALFRQMRAYDENPTPGRRTAFLASSLIGLAAYSLPALFIWLNPDPLVKFTGVLSLIGALLNVSVVRSTHLGMGILSGLPPALALLWLPLQYLFDPIVNMDAALAVAGVIVLLGYFASALVQNHRTQSELVAAIAHARETSRAKSRFLSAMSHEVRTPLNVILGHSQLMREQADPATVRGHAAAVESAARGMQMLVEDVIDLASVTEGEVRFQPVTAVIRPELEVVASMKLPLNGHTDPDVTIEIAPEVPEFGRFDPVLLRKCLSHLSAIVLNEQPTGRPPAINMRCALAPGRKDRLRLTIAGREPSRPADQRDQTPAEGSLALTLVHSIAEVIGAKAAILRAPDGSLVARIELPFVTVPDPPATGAETVYGRLRALVVDDIATNRFVVVQMLRALRIEADEASGGSDALERLAEGEFDIVLLDMNMPDMDGEATFREIRGSGADWANIPVVALTADAVARQRDFYMSLGLTGFVSKPVDKRLLWAEILSAVPPPPPL